MTVSHPHRRVPIALAILFASASILGTGAPAAAATFIAGSCNSSSTLIPFIEAANDESLNAGPDTIVLKAGCTYLLIARYADTVFGLPPIETPITIIGNGARIEWAADAPSFAFFDVKSGAALTLSNLTLKEGSGQNSTGASVHNRGSAVLSGVTITHSVPFGQSGPGIYNEIPGALAIIGSTIEGQLAVLADGSAIVNRGTMTVTSSTIRRNAGSPAMSNSGTAEVFDSTFDSNATDGAIWNGGDLKIHTSSFVGNQASSGGAIRNTSDLQVDGSYFADNGVTSEGGAILNGPVGLAKVVNSTFYDNVANGRFSTCCTGIGGAIANHHSLRIEHVTFSRNGAGSGSAIASPEGLAVVQASVFDFSRGGGFCSGNFADFGSNLMETPSSGCPSTFAVGDPNLQFPEVNGIGTKTLDLGPSSAAVDIVASTSCPAYDQRGFGRVAGQPCDAGAYEDQPPTVPGIPGLVSGGSPNAGTFLLGWGTSTDPDGDTLTYRVSRRDADDSAYQLAGTSVFTPLLSVVAESEGTNLYIVAADDGNHVSASSGASAPIVVDRTGPSAPNAQADRAPDAGDWYRDTVTVTFSGSVDPALADGSAGSGVASTTAPQTRSASGTFALSGSSSDVVGNISSTTTLTVKVDAENPMVGFSACPDNAILQSVTAAPWTASDASSGLSGSQNGNVPLDTTTIGTKAVSVTATDLVGHSATATCSYDVIYDFKGFFSPLVEAPAMLDWRAGDGISVAFSIGGNQGLGVLAPGYPQSAPVSCTAPATLDSGVATTSPRPLDFIGGKNGRYRYQWATETSWAGTCRQLIVKLADGTHHRANIRFR